MKLKIDCQYFPSVNYYKNSINYSHWIIFESERYEKSGKWNRCLVAGAQGPIGLSVPLAGGRHQKGGLKDIRIANREAWQLHHWRTLTACYNRSPWFEFYRDGLEGIYAERQEFLIDWNWTCLDWTIRVLGLQVTLEKRMGPPDEEGRMEPGLVALPEATGKVTADPKSYRQVFQERTGFISGLSILDLIFCEGKNAIEWLKTS